jgi:NAD(P)-dependent dehydrogenase (short-subunit alcohol dehydrogenase family)
MVEEEDLKGVVAQHRERFGRLDVLVNNAGVGIGQPMGELASKYVDIQLGVNLRAVILMTRECLPMLREAGAEHGKALIVNTASIAGKAGQAWLSVYSATKAAVIGFSQSTQNEVGHEGIQVTALAPGFVDTPMTEFVREQVKPEQMIQPRDIAEAVRFLLRTSPHCVVPEIVFMRPEDAPSAGGP